MSMRPLVGGCTPQTILTSVDLPAPLSPTSATTSPALSVERHALEGDDAAELLADILEAEDRRIGTLRGFYRGDIALPPQIGHATGRP